MSNGPYYSCEDGSCAEHISYQPEDLFVYDGKVWCEGCFEQEHSGDDYDDVMPFRPEQVSTIIQLQARVAELEGYNLEYALHEQKLQDAITRIDTTHNDNLYGGLELAVAIKDAVELVEGK